MWAGTTDRREPGGDVKESPQMQIRPLAEEECRELLVRNHLGRIAFTFQDRVDLQPIFYVFDGEWIFGRTSPGEKLSTLQHHRWLAFQVDEIRDLWNWNSVMVRGTFHELTTEGTDADREVHARALKALEEVLPEAFTDRDPGAFRSVLFGIAPTEITGRCAWLPPSRGPSD
jgi:uncharacterized protein